MWENSFRNWKIRFCEIFNVLFYQLFLWQNVITNSYHLLRWRWKLRMHNLEGTLLRNLWHNKCVHLIAPGLPWYPHNTVCKRFEFGGFYIHQYTFPLPHSSDKGPAVICRHGWIKIRVKDNIFWLNEFHLYKEKRLTSLIIKYHIIISYT